MERRRQLGVLLAVDRRRSGQLDGEAKYIAGECRVGMGGFRRGKAVVEKDRQA